MSNPHVATASAWEDRAKKAECRLAEAYGALHSLVKALKHPDAFPYPEFMAAKEVLDRAWLDTLFYGCAHKPGGGSSMEFSSEELSAIYAARDRMDDRYMKAVALLREAGTAYTRHYEVDPIGACHCGHKWPCPQAGLIEYQSDANTQPKQGD